MLQRGRIEVVRQVAYIQTGTAAIVKIKTANMLESALSKLLVVQERYPQLKANRNFQSIQRSIGSVESQILNERKYYNEVVRRYNVRVKLFPRNVIAKMFGFGEREFFSNEQ